MIRFPTRPRVPSTLVDKHESLETQSRASGTTFYFYNDSSAIALVWINILVQLTISKFIIVSVEDFIVFGAEKLNLYLWKQVQVLYQKVKVKKFTRESESWKLKTRLFRSPREPRRLRDANPLHVLWTPPWHSCSDHLHNDQGEVDNEIIHGKYKTNPKMRNNLYLREAVVSKKCSFFEHLGSTHVQKLCRKLSCVLEVI